MPYIPPGYKDVRVIDDPKSKIYAYGYDKKGRKQIIYNTWFIEDQRDKRFKHILNLRESIRALKDKIQQILSAEKVNANSKEVQICVILRLMMLCNFRIGNMKYLKENGSYGLTTLAWKHIQFDDINTCVHIEFIGKKGVLNQSTCNDGLVLRVLTVLHKKRPEGQVIAKKQRRVFSVSSSDVNEYVSRFNADMTTKDIRTWHANYLYVRFYKQAQKEGHKADKARTIAITRVAASLHNTPAVCKKNYLLPELISQT